ncbi:hypothetical protein B0T16DRAFT_377619 [Cercophora newfieldiana]|uniref:Uncharacterized protein n=1 Tax=Cercophora newfieldiana TaxID=92897 RepID=A0AA39Y385_9PEZI|nr:hypothetical protein B0T16DRAFT_377619 [Cercophora newfieldiana]
MARTTQKTLATALALSIGATARLSPRALLSPAVIENVLVDPPVIDIPTPPIVLAPLRGARKGNTKRDRRFALELKTSETFDWIGSDGTIAELKVETPGQDENIVNLELIDDMVQGVECPASGTGDLKIRFAQAADFDDAEDIWKWVNKNPANHFLMVVGVGMCGGNVDRVLYSVTGLGYVDEAETAVLQVKETTWKEAAHTFDLTIGKVAEAQVPARVKSRRGVFDKIKEGFDKAVEWVKGVPAKVEEVVDDIINPDLQPDFAIPFNNKLPNSALAFTANGISVSAVCKECFTAGSLDVKGRFRVELLDLKDAWVEVSTPGLTTKALIALNLKGAITAKLAEKSVPIFKASPAGISIPGVLSIGPVVSVNMGVELSEITASVDVEVGGSAHIPPSSARLDFLSKDRTTSTGWTPELKAEPLKATAQVEAKASAFIRPVVGLEVSVVETGFSAEIFASTPILTAAMKGITTTNCTACGDSENGIQGALTLGANVGASLKKKVLGDQNALFSVIFAQTSLPIAGFCQGFGPSGDECLGAFNLTRAGGQ